MIVKLFKNEYEDVLQVALERNENKEKLGIKHYGFSEQYENALACHIRGISAEKVVSKVTGFDLNREISEKGDKGLAIHSDLILPNNKTVEIKMRERGKEFILPSFNPEKFTQDYGILVFATKDPMTFEIVGYITRETFLQNYKRKDFGKGIRCYITREFFLPIEQWSP